MGGTCITCKNHNWNKIGCYNKVGHCVENNKWEAKTMDKKEAIQAMLDGKKVRRSVWEEKTAYLFFDMTRNEFQTDGKTRTDINYQYVTGWEIYTEPPVPKFKVGDFVRYHMRFMRVVAIDIRKPLSYDISDGQYCCLTTEENLKAVAD